jgi:futalosine hydrolase
LGTTRITVEAGLVKKVAAALSSAGLPVSTGAVLTVATVTGTAETVAEMLRRVPGAAVEAMEGYGVAVAAQDSGVPVLEMRAVSNLVGPRDKDTWQIKEALEVLERACAVLGEVLS